MEEQTLFSNDISMLAEAYADKRCEGKNELSYCVIFRNEIVNAYIAGTKYTDNNFDMLNGMEFDERSDLFSNEGVEYSTDRCLHIGERRLFYPLAEAFIEGEAKEYQIKTNGE